MGLKTRLETRGGSHAMNNFEVGKKLLSEAEEYREELQHAFSKGLWNVVIRRSQEIV